MGTLRYLELQVEIVETVSQTFRLWRKANPTDLFECLGSNDQPV